MTRKPRFNLPGVPQHVLPLSAIHGLRGTGASCPAQRGNTREPRFYGAATITVISMICGRPPTGMTAGCTPMY
jgi:hypothetical protein